MTAKELLEKIVQLRKKIDYTNTKIAMLIEQATNTTAALTGMPHNPSGDKSRMATAIAKKIDAERDVEQLTAERNGYIAKIDMLDNGDEQRVLTLRYVKEEQWDDIMAEVGYGPAQTYRIHRTAIRSLDIRLKDDSK